MPLDHDGAPNRPAGVSPVRNRLLGQGHWPGPIHQLLDTYAHECGGVRFVQVGSCDAAFGDPIIDFVLSWDWHPRGAGASRVPEVAGAALLRSLRLDARRARAWVVVGMSLLGQTWNRRMTAVGRRTSGIFR